MTDAPRTGKPCHRCDTFVRMSGPEAARDANTWTTCAACRRMLELEAAYVGQPSTTHYPAAIPPGQTKDQ